MITLLSDDVCYHILMQHYHDCIVLTDKWGPCHHGTARPPDMEGSCEYTEQEVADSRRGVVLQLGG
jgi:hypothetical protein